jgi:hypothetical protein
MNYNFRINKIAYYRECGEVGFLPFHMKPDTGKKTSSAKVISG